MKKIIVFSFLLLSENIFSKPLLQVGFFPGQEDYKIFVANCVSFSDYPSTLWLRQDNGEFLDLVYVDAPKIKHPRTAYLDFENFRRQHQNRPIKLYGLVSHGRSESGCLVQIDALSGEMTLREDLGFSVKTGHLSKADMYYGNTWHTVLIMVANGYQDSASQIKIYDITNPSNPFAEPYFQTSNIGEVKAAPIAIRLQGRDGFVLSSETNNRGIVQIFFVDTAAFMGPWIFEQSLSFLMAIDLYHQGEVSRIYALNESGLWAIPLSSNLINAPQKLLNIVGLSIPLVIKDPHGMGVKLYFFGQRENEEGIYEIHDYLTADNRATTKLLQAGQFINQYVYAGNLILIPKDPLSMPSVIQLSSSPDLNSSAQWINWQMDARGLGPERRLSREPLVASKLIGSKGLAVESLLTLNDSCQLNILHPARSIAYQGEFSCRKLSNKQFSLYEDE